MNPLKKLKYKTIDARFTLINMTICESQDGVIITAYVNGMSVRSGSLFLPRVADVFIDTVVVACDFPDDEAYDEDIARLERDIACFIDGVVKLHHICDQ